MSKPSIRLLRVGMIATTCLLVTGCSWSETQQRLAVSVQEPISLVIPAKTPGLDPVASQSTDDLIVLHAIHPTVLQYDSESSGEILGLGETAVYVSDTEFQVSIKKGMRFANGNPLTASDVAFSLNRFKTIVKDGVHSRLLDSFVSARAVGEETVAIQLSLPVDISFPHALTSIAGMIVDEQVYDDSAATPDRELFESRAFAGTYVVDSHSQAESEILLSPNDSRISGSIEPKNNGLELSFTNNSSGLIETLATRKPDVVFALGSLDYQVMNIHKMQYPRSQAAGFKSIEGFTLACKSLFAGNDELVLASGSQTAAIAVAIKVAVENNFAELTDPGFVVLSGSIVPSDALGFRRVSTQSILDGERSLSEFKASESNLPEILSATRLGKAVPLAEADLSLRTNSHESIASIALRTSNLGDWLKFAETATTESFLIEAFRITPQFQDASAVLGAALGMRGGAMNPISTLGWRTSYQRQSSVLEIEQRERLIPRVERQIRQNSCMIPLFELQPTLFLSDGFSINEKPSNLDFSTPILGQIQRSESASNN